MLDLVIAGEAFDDFVFYGLDRLPKNGEELKTDRFGRSSGGGAVITAIAAARLGARCATFSGLSRDAARLLRDEGVGVRNLLRRGEEPAISIAISTRQDRCFVTFNGMNHRLPGRLKPLLARARARHVHLAFHPRPCRPWIAVVESLRRRGITSSWDFGWNPGLVRDPDFRRLAASVDYVFLNRDEALLYSRQRQFVRALARWRRFPRLVVVKLGAGGSRVIGGGNGNVDVHVAAPAVRVVDTTGAGDAFNAGFLVARLRGSAIAAALSVANRVGAMSTRRPGGIAGLPRLRASR